MQASSTNSGPTETSPLLQASRSNARRLSTTTDPGAGLVPGSNNAGVIVADQANDGDPERQQNGEETTKRSGLPEVRKRMKYIFPALAIGVFLSAADQTIIIASYGIIGSQLNALNKTSWIATAYFLTLTSSQPLYGKISDIFGRKACLLVAYAIFGLGCLACGLARNINELIAARAFSGIGGGGMSTVSSILMSDILTLRERGKWQGYINLVWATGSALGAPLGGFAADYLSWRWAFSIQAPLCLLSIIAVSLVVELPKRDASHWRDNIRRIDFTGALVLICAVFGLLFALDRGSNVSWTAKEALIPLAISIPLFFAFVYVEFYFAAEPFAPKRILANGGLLAGYFCNFFSFAGWLAAFFFIPLYLQVVHGLNATEASVLLIPSVICGVGGSLFAGFYMEKTGKYYWLTVICYTTLAIGMTIITLCSGLVVKSKLGLVLGMCLCAFSNGQGVTSTLIALIANATTEDQAVVIACSYLFRSLGSVFGLSISATAANTVLRTYLARKLGDGHEAAEIVDRVRESLSYIKSLEPAVRAVVVDCYAKSTQAALALEIALVVGATISAWFIREKSLNR